MNSIDSVQNSMKSRKSGTPDVNNPISIKCLVGNYFLISKRVCDHTFLETWDGTVKNAHAFRKGKSSIPIWSCARQCWMLHVSGTLLHYLCVFRHETAPNNTITVTPAPSIYIGLNNRIYYCLGKSMKENTMTGIFEAVRYKEKNNLFNSQRKLISCCCTWHFVKRASSTTWKQNLSYESKGVRGVVPTSTWESTYS